MQTVYPRHLIIGNVIVCYSNIVFHLNYWNCIKTKIRKISLQVCNFEKNLKKRVNGFSLHKNKSLSVWFPSLEIPHRVALYKCTKALKMPLKKMSVICYIYYSKSFIVSKQYEIIFFSNWLLAIKFPVMIEYLLRK